MDRITVNPPDLSIVDLHRLPPSGQRIEGMEGAGYLVLEQGRKLAPLRPGQILKIGETVALEPNATLKLHSLRLLGGPRGMVHAFVDATAFSASPGRAAVPMLLSQLEAMEKRGHLEEEIVRTPPKTVFERASAADFARANLDLSAAAKVPKALAQAHRAICLFVSAETAFVAMSDVSPAALRALIETLGYPVNPHLVPSEVIDELLSRVY